MVKTAYMIKLVNNTAGTLQFEVWGRPTYSFLIAIWSLVFIWSCWWTDLTKESIPRLYYLQFHSFHSLIVVDFLLFQRKDAPQIRRLTTVIIQLDTTNSLKSERSDFGTTTTQCTSIVSCWPVTVIILILGWSQIIQLHCKQGKSVWIHLAGF